MKRLITIMLLAVLFPLLANSNDLFLKEPVFQSGEKVKFNVYYNWGFIWIHAGNIDFSVADCVYDGKPSYSLTLAGSSTKAFDNMYCIRDTFETFVDVDSFYPRYYSETKHEDSYYSNLKYKYEPLVDSTIIELDWTKKTRRTFDTLTIDKQTYDLISCCYKIRNIDVHSVKVDQTVPFSMLLDKDVYNLGLTYKGRTSLKLKNGERYNVLKFIPQVVTGDLFKKEDDMVIYVSDDDNHIPLMVEAKVKFGCIKAMLCSAENTKYPVSALITE